MGIMDNPFVRFYGIVLIVGTVVSLVTIMIGRRSKKRFVKYIFPVSIVVLAFCLYGASLFQKESMKDLALVVMGYMVFLEGIIGIAAAVIYDFVFKKRGKFNAVK